MQSPSHQPPQRATTISIDPGYRYLGFAVWGGDELLKAGLLKASPSSEWDRWDGQPPSFVEIGDLILNTEWSQRYAIIEFPKVYRTTPNADSIVRLAAACGAYTGILQAAGFQVEWVEPRAWKGTVPKDIMYKRILAKVPKSKYTVIDKIHDHNVVDAVGIGLWKLRQRAGSLGSYGQGG